MSSGGTGGEGGEPAWAWIQTWQGLLTAGLGMILTVAISSIHIARHLFNYHEPAVQRYTIRVVLMVPIYAINSFISLSAHNREVAFVFTLVRDCYEAYTIFNFLALCLAYVGGQAMLVHLWQSDERKMPTSYLWGTCCLGSVALDHRFLRRIMQGCVQFIVVKLVLAVVTLVLEFMGYYGEGTFRLDGGYLYVAVLYNLSICVALYALMAFYFAAEPYLKPHKPVLKFVMIKLIIFVTFWQAVVISALFSFDVIEPIRGTNNASSAVLLQSFLICVECLPLALLNFVGFPPSRVLPGAKTSIVKSLKHFIKINDVVIDATTNVNRRYSEFTSLGHSNVDLEEDRVGEVKPDGTTTVIVNGVISTTITLEPLPEARDDGSDGNDKPA